LTGVISFIRGQLTPNHGRGTGQAAHHASTGLKENDMTAPELLKEQMPLVRRIEANLQEYGYEKGAADYDHAFKTEIKYYRKFGWTVSKGESK
jgi:hypothetical protein